MERPLRTPAAATGAVIGYTPSNPDGDDGGPITDYDVIGSAQTGTGLFALHAAPDINLLCIPPLTRDHDIGLSTLLVAGRFCRERRAMLIVDPLFTWASSAAALDGMRHGHSAVKRGHVLPRVVAFDRLRGRFEMFAPCGVAAGMIARCDETWPVGGCGGRRRHPAPGLRVGVEHPERRSCPPGECGINLLQSVRIAPSSPPARARSRWLGCRQRLALPVASPVGALHHDEHRARHRWMFFERNAQPTWTMA
jgi:hypothetical protein